LAHLKGWSPAHRLGQTGMEGTEVDQHVGGQEKVRDERGNQVQLSNQYKAKERNKIF